MKTKSHTAGHRDRLRERFRRNGFDGFHDYEVLEYLLTFIFIRGDVKPLAKQLISTFGSFTGVLDAPVAELAQVPGMGRRSAEAIHAFRGAMAFYFRDNAAKNTQPLTRISQLVDLLRAQIGHEPNEVLYAIFLNAANEVLAMKTLGEGTITQAAAFPRRIAEEAISAKAAAVILAHNHPGGVAEPSEDDLRITTEIRDALNLLGIMLQDHIIISPSNYYSFKRHQQL